MEFAPRTAADVDAWERDVLELGTPDPEVDRVDRNTMVILAVTIVGLLVAGVVTVADRLPRRGAGTVAAVAAAPPPRYVADGGYVAPSSQTRTTLPYARTTPTTSAVDLSDMVYGLARTGCEEVVDRQDPSTRRLLRSSAAFRLTSAGVYADNFVVSPELARYHSSAKAGCLAGINASL